MPTDLELLALCQESYDRTTIESEDAHVLVTESVGVTIFAFRGTDLRCIVDLWRDADNLTVSDHLLGELHQGFYQDACSVAWQLVPLARSGCIITGHSKGGAEALDFAGMLVSLGIIPGLVTTFGSACPGLLPMVRGMPGTDWRNRYDQIPYLPRRPRPRPLTQLGLPRPCFNPLDDHGLDQYATSLRALAHT